MIQLIVINELNVITILKCDQIDLYSFFKKDQIKL